MAEWTVPEGAEAQLEEMRSSVLSDWLGTCSLAFVPEGQVVAVTNVAETATRLLGLGIEEGVSLTCVRNSGHRVLVRLACGREVTLGLREAWMLQVTTPPSLVAWRQRVVETGARQARRRRRGGLPKDR